MITIHEVNKKVKPLLFSGAKIPHGISNPVIRKEEGEFVIAYFGYLYNKQNLLTNKYSRPVQWMLVDIETGELIKTYSCIKNDFSKEPNDKMYSLDDPTVKKPTSEFFDVMDHLFDTVRASLIFGKAMDMESYKAYMNSLMAITPTEYRVFYKELSI